MDQFNANLEYGWMEVMINFDAAHFDVLWALVEDAVLPKWLMGRGRRHITKPKDAILMMLTVLKHYNTWEKHASDFSMRTSTFEKLVGKMIDIVEPILFSHLIRPASMKEQPANRPTGLFSEQKRYFSGKHWQYGFKLECAVAYPGVAVHLWKHYPGSVHDMTIFSKNLATHRKLLAKTDEDGAVADYGELALEYPDQHIMLVDKGYVGAPNHMRCIYPKKGSAATLSREDVARNQRISSDRVIVENTLAVCARSGRCLQ
ncbi:TPA: hypothetical protein N0F65_002647 [Lagenidium giganteum]|uniref:DDE Tnp4 domain-containing protein n=1 Tax=Lagenidium giganteum TaxID=4803 RepID=A0AAV2Z5M9_9STRA|nr:TPA: hypothetical protein N0F65_002647 [Lagenidium giganteum]